MASRECKEGDLQIGRGAVFKSQSYRPLSNRWASTVRKPHKVRLDVDQRATWTGFSGS